MKEWRIAKIEKVSGGGFLTAVYPPGYAPPVAERAFSTAEELHGWLAIVLGVTHAGKDFPKNWGEPE